MPVSSIPFVRRKGKDSTSREKRKEMRDMTLETAGGVYGGAIGAALGSTLGPVGTAGGGIVGSGLGSAAGRGLSMLEDQLEYGDMPGRTAQSAMREMGDAAIMGAVGEGAGRAMPMIGNLTNKAVRQAFKPTAEAKTLTALADKYGIPLNLAERSGKTWLRLAEVGLDRMPFATNTIRKARREQYKAWTDAINKTLDDVHTGNITLDEFAVMADEAFAGLRANFNKTVESQAASTASKIRANPATKTEAGVGLVDARQKNLDVVKDWARREYGAIEREFGNVGVPMGSLSDGLQQISPAAESLFTSKAKNTLEAARRLTGESNSEYTKALQEVADAVGVGSIEELQQRIPALYQKEVDRLADVGISAIKGGGNLPYSQVMELRSQILDSISRLSSQPNATDTRALYGLLDNINEAVESGFKSAAANTTGDEAAKLLKATERIKQTNSTYRAEMRRLNPPRGAKEDGNIAATKLNDTRLNPDEITTQIVNSPTMIEGAARATSPEAMSAVERVKFDDMVRGATVIDPITGETRISPTMFRKDMRGYLPMKKLFGKNAVDVESIGSKDLVRGETELYRRSLPKAVDTGSGERAIRAAFPPRSPVRVAQNIETLDAAGIKSEAQRAYLDDIVAKGYKTDPALGPDAYLSGERFSKAIENTGDTFSDVVGPKATEELGDLAKVGRTMRSSEKEFGNPSGTGRSLEILQTAGTLLAAPIYPTYAAYAAAEGVASNVAARAFTNQNLGRWLTSPGRSSIPMIGAPMAAPFGAGGQVANRARSFFGTPMPPRLEDQDLDANFIPDEELDRNFIPEN